MRASIGVFLGGVYPGAVSATDDINNNKTTGYFLCNGDAAHLPSIATYHLLVFSRGSEVIQFAVESGTSVLKVRTLRNNLWTSWV